MIRCLPMVLALAVMVPALADPPVKAPEKTPAYPYVLPSWYVKQREAMRTLVTLDYDGTSLTAVAADVAKRTKTKIDVEIVGAAPAGIHLRVVGLEASSALSLVAELQSLKVVHDVGRVVVTDAPGRYPQPQHAAIRKQIERVRRSVARAKKPSEDPEGAKARAFCTDKTYAFAVEFASLEEALTQLVKTTGAPVLIHPTANKFHRVSVALEGKTVEAIVDAILKGSNSVRTYMNGRMIVSSARSAKALRAQRKAASVERARLAKVLARTIDADLSGMRMPALVSALRGALGVPVHPDPASWATPSTMPKLARGATVAQVIDALLTIDVRLVPDRSGGLFLLARPRAEGGK